MPRVIHTLLLMLLLVLLPAAAAANTGVAFVHGTGKQTNALADYWTAPFVNSVRQGLPNQASYLVVNCDFQQYMWDSRAAGCLAGQLHGFITSRNITDLVVITHSNGGNVMRWILSNHLGQRYPLIIQRTRWSMPWHRPAGTPLAVQISGNLFENALGWLLGYQTTPCASSRSAG